MSFRAKLVGCVRGPLVSMSAVSGDVMRESVNVQIGEMRIG